jgi:hypothetical protein
MLPAERIEGSIMLLRGQKVLLDADLATLYGVETRALVQAVQRNKARFPDDFMFRLTKEEFADLRSQTVISGRWGGRRYEPYAFTEQGVAMLSSVLRSDRAVQVNIEINARLRAPAEPARLQRRALEQARLPRAEVRRAVPGRLPGDPRTHDTARAGVHPARAPSPCHRLPHGSLEAIETPLPGGGRSPASDHRP